MFIEYKNCIYCKSKNLTIEKDQSYLENFYVKAIKSDLNLSSDNLKKIKIHKCNRCNILQNSPWFNDDTSLKIYSNIYGQHNRNWTNLINFMEKQLKPNHGFLFNILTKNIKVKNYAEFNSPFMGLFINFFENEYKKNKSFYKNFSKNILNYLSARQTAGKSKNFQKTSPKKAKKYLKQINNFKNKKTKKQIINKYLFVDNSNLCWWQNDNYKSVNSRSYASELLDLKILDLNKEFKQKKIDLFGIFHTLDHTFEPKKILDFALKTSKYVIVYCHTDKKLNKQHLFSLTNNFLKYLNKNKIYTFDLTDKIGKKFKSPELYFICSRQRNLINKIKKNVN